MIVNLHVGFVMESLEVALELVESDIRIVMTVSLIGLDVGEQTDLKLCLGLVGCGAFSFSADWFAKRSDRLPSNEM